MLFNIRYALIYICLTRGDLIQIYKIINKMEVVDIDMGIGNNQRTAGGGQTRRHGYQIEKEISVNYPMRN